MNTTDKTLILKDPLESLLGYQLRRAALVTLSALVDSFTELGLSATEAIVIRFVHANPGCSQSDIGRAVGVKRTNMVPIVNGLMTRGLLERTPADGRSHSLFLTEQGVDLQRKIAKVTLENEKIFFGDVTEDMRKTLMTAFRTVRAKAEEIK